eukprot:gene2512-3110_t
MTSPAKKPMQKFGVQTEKGKIIHCWRNGDKYQETGARILVHATKFKTYDQLKVEMSKKVELFTGSVSKVYSMDKKLMKTLDDFQDGFNYICCGAEALNTEMIPKGLVGTFGKQEQATPSVSTGTSEQESTPQPTSSTTTPASTTTTTTTSVSSISAQKTLESLQTEKSKVIYAFRNGDRTHKGERVTIHPLKFRNYDQLKEQLSTQVKLVTGPVRKVFTTDGKLVKAMEDFVDGHKYICCSGEAFNSVDFPPAALASS